MTKINWKEMISKIALSKQIAAQHDKNQALRWHLPKVAASSQEISEAEKKSGIVFSDQYKELLSHVNGWPGFYVSVDLFGTDDFIKNRHTEAVRRPELVEYLRSMGVDGRSCVVGASKFDLDVFVLVSSDQKKKASEVLWFAAEEVDTYSGVSDFIASMVKYNEMIAKEMASGK